MKPATSIQKSARTAVIWQYQIKNILLKLDIMKSNTTMNLNGSLAIGGGLLAGLGGAFFFLQSNPLYFVGCLLGGLGIGLILASIVGHEKKTEAQNTES
jgi:hypothetical protein